MARYGAVDVHYPPEGGATAALVVATTAIFAPVTEEHTITQETALPYKPARSSNANSHPSPPFSVKHRLSTC